MKQATYWLLLKSGKIVLGVNREPNSWAVMDLNGFYSCVGDESILEKRSIRIPKWPKWTMEVLHCED